MSHQKGGEARTMRAIVQDRYGPPEILALHEIERPAFGDDDVVARVRAASVNFRDWAVLRGRPRLLRLATGLRRPKAPVPGVDLVGVVEAVGATVTTLRPGDEVFGRCDGAFAEYAVSAQARLVTKPANLRFEQAAAVPLAATTALQDTAGPGPRSLLLRETGNGPAQDTRRSADVRALR